MDNKEIVQVRFPKKIVEDINEIVEEGYYASRSEYVQEQVRKSILERKEKQI